MRFVDVVFAAALAVALAACEPPPPCPECPRTPPAVPRDAGPRDAGQPSPPPPGDGGQDWPDGGAVECRTPPETSLSAAFWRLDLTRELWSCSVEHASSDWPGSCTGCASDVIYRCASISCREECGLTATSSACRACVCRSCVMEPSVRELCVACDPTSDRCHDGRSAASVHVLASMVIR